MPDATALTPAERWALAATVLGSSLAFLDGTVVNVALSAVQRDLNATASGVQWVVGACALAPSLGTLVTARAALGLGAALLVPGSPAMIGAVFAESRRGRGVGLWSAASSVTTLLGPVVGGVLVNHASWRWVFLINLPLAALTLWLLRGVPETRAPGAHPDWAGAAWVTVALGRLALALTRAGEPGWDALTWGLLAGSGLAFALFGQTQRRSAHPMLPPGLLRNRTFLGTNLLTLLLYGALGAVSLYLPMLLIGRGYSARRCCRCRCCWRGSRGRLARWLTATAPGCS